MNAEIEENIRKSVPWAKLPTHVKQLLGNSQREYERIIVTFSIKNQLRYRGNLVKNVLRNEKRYYERIIAHSRDRLMLFPYHLADMICKGLRITPFSYYISVLEKLMQAEKSYDTLPNFTAADCLRLLNIGRNEYIELMNKSRSNRGRLFGKQNVRVLLPPVPCNISIEPWWRVEVGLVLENDIKMVTTEEQNLIDLMIDFGSQTAGEHDYHLIQSLYRKGLVYVDVPITGADRVQVPPLQGFVMNRVLGDYFETLLYKIFVSIDEHMTVGELAAVLQIEIELVKQAVSLYCRLGFARKMNTENEMTRSRRHTSWNNIPSHIVRSPGVTPLTLNLNCQIPNLDDSDISTPSTESPAIDSNSPSGNTLSRSGQRIAFLFDSSLTAFLMMGNLSPGLKNHAVTMFEVGKLCDESLDSFLTELEKVSLLDAEGEGEARRYFDHAVILRSTVLALRRLPMAGLDLVRLESLHSLDSNTCKRLLSKKYKLLVSMAPLSREVPLITSYAPPHLGPAVPEVNSIWFKLYIYHMTGYGPPSLLLTQGTVLKHLPRMFLGFSRLLVMTWSQEPTVLNVSNILHINTALQYSSVFMQAYGVMSAAETVIVPFPVDDEKWAKHPAVQNLMEVLDLVHSCGYLTMANIGVKDLGCENRDRNVRLGKTKSSANAGSAQKIKLDVKPPEPTSISNENFRFPTEKPKSEPTREESEISLRSPVESHFAITPVTQSSSNSPANGFTSEDCSDILCQELEKLDKEQLLSVESNVNKPTELKLDIVTIESIMSPTEENISMFTIRDDKNEDDEQEIITPGQSWTILDCSFGVPLFDADANTKICHAIISGGLTEVESLDKQVESSRKIGSSLLEFISQCQYYPGENMGIMKRGRLVPHPKRNLVFDNGRVTDWPGK